MGPVALLVFKSIFRGWVKFLKDFGSSAKSLQTSMECDRFRCIVTGDGRYLDTELKMDFQPNPEQRSPL